MRNNIVSDCWRDNIYISSDNCVDVYENSSNYYSGDITFGCVDNWTNIVDVDPKLVDPSNNDYTLQSTSTMRDAGVWLTYTNGTGTGSKTLIVDDATYFIDGYGIVTGDTIQIEGDSTTAVVTDITGNTITIDTSLTWTDGKGVSLAYENTAPDIGAYQYPVPLPAEPAQATPSNNGAVWWWWN